MRAMDAQIARYLDQETSARPMRRPRTRRWGLVALSVVRYFQTSGQLLVGSSGVVLGPTICLYNLCPCGAAGPVLDGCAMQ